MLTPAWGAASVRAGTAVPGIEVGLAGVAPAALHAVISDIYTSTNNKLERSFMG